MTPKNFQEGRSLDHLQWWFLKGYSDTPLISVGVVATQMFCFLTLYSLIAFVEGKRSDLT